nr:PREDICTED: uncharacterized protein LOC100563267 [Anolis carolinensis]|eukprot:XP_008103667.1 PREDICTED: uncharacterized protein LOC100563267 [Anolis carolinensis]
MPSNGSLSILDGLTYLQRDSLTNQQLQPFGSLTPCNEESMNEKVSGFQTDLIESSWCRLQMETIDNGTSDQLTDGDVDKEALSEISEDVFYGLNPEEKECLEYFLQTINTFDGDILNNNDEESHEEMSESLGSEDQAEHAVDSRIQESMPLEAAPAKSVSPHPAVFATKMIKSSSEECSDITLRIKSNCPKIMGPHRLADPHSVNLRKFDTIMRSGVNVQELRSRFLLQLGGSTTVDRETTELPKDGGLQKLNNLQRNKSVPTVKSPQMSIACQQTQISPAERMEHEVTESTTSTAEKPF